MTIKAIVSTFVLLLALLAPLSAQDPQAAPSNQARFQERLEKMKERIQTETAKDLHLKCPKCDGTLYETDYEGITVDVCDKCTGVWLDAGELTQIVGKDDEGGGWFSKMFG